MGARMVLASKGAAFMPFAHLGGLGLRAAPQAIG